MKKIPTLFERQYENHKVVGITNKVTPGCEWVLEGEGTPTVKYDGSACAIIKGKAYKRYDAKKGKPIPDNAIKCQPEPDPVTGHMPCWVPIDPSKPEDKWFVKAFVYTIPCEISDHELLIWYSAISVSTSPDIVTFEAVGPHFQGNAEHLEFDEIIRHGIGIIHDLPGRSFEDIRAYLKCRPIEGIVFWKDGEPKCKIKRSDFGFEWPITSYVDFKYPENPYKDIGELPLKERV